MRTRVLVSLAIGLVAGLLCWMFLSHFNQGGGDFNWAIWAARDLAARRNPYTRPMQLYPLPAAFFGLPLAWLRPEIAAAIFYGASSTLLAFGLTRSGYRRLFAFFAYPYWAGLMSAQWPPLIMAGAFFPLLLCAGLAKPQLGLPVALAHLSRRGATACVVLALLSFAMMPSWLGSWRQQFSNYQHFYPLLIFPGVFLLLALLSLRDRDARLLFVAAIMPQRWFYDAFILWLIPKTRWEMLCTVFLSWAPGVWRWYFFPGSFTQVGRMAVIFFYLPMLAVILLRGRSRVDCQSDCDWRNTEPSLKKKA